MIDLINAALNRVFAGNKVQVFTDNNMWTLTASVSDDPVLRELDNGTQISSSEVTFEFLSPPNNFMLKKGSKIRNEKKTYIVKWVEFKPNEKSIKAIVNEI